MPDDVGDAANVPVVRLVARPQVVPHGVVKVVHRDLVSIVLFNQVMLVAHVIGQ